MEIGPVLLTQGHTHARNAHVTDVQYYGSGTLSTKSVDAVLPAAAQARSLRSAT